MASLNLDKLSAVAKSAIGLVVVVLLGVGYFLVFYTELASAIERAQQAELGLRNELVEARQNEHLYQKDLAELTQREQRQNQLSKILPNSTEYPAFLSAIQSAANVSGVTLTAWAPQPEGVEKFYARVPMRLELQGRFHQIAKFFYGVGQLDRIINMENITMTEPKVVDQDTVIRVTGLATAFRTLGVTESTQSKRPPTKGAKK
jgi:type IV pilus assembly protein PilO